MMIMVSSLSRLSKVYKCIGTISIVLGLFLLIVSIGVAIHGDRVSSEPIVGVFLLSEGVFMLFAGCIGQAIDDIRNNTEK